MTRSTLAAFILNLHDLTKDREQLGPSLSASTKQTYVASLAQRLALAGFALYALFAPHSIAGAEIALALAALGWLVRTVATKRTGIRRTSLDLPIGLFFTWTIASAFLSSEPAISLAKIQSVCVLFMFYLTQAVLTRRTALILAALMIASGVAGTLWSIADVVRGRGVILERVAEDSPFRATPVQAGDVVWRTGGHRVASIKEIDDSIKRAQSGTRLNVSVIAQGEHAEWPGFIITDEIKARTSPSGLDGKLRTHRFRASGWTRHYEAFAETLQILAQLALGLALANFLRRRARWPLSPAVAATLLLSVGVTLTAMRTVVVALAVGAGIIAWRAARGRARSVLAAAIAMLLALGALMVWQTRAGHALMLQDASASLRLNVARVGLSRIMLHPFFGHGMDAMQKHWTEWGFPGTDMLHMHSTPLQLAFDRGLPALIFWLWIIAAFWRLTSRAERLTRESTDTNRHGLLLGATGALAGFFASSLVNYNFGAGIVALAFWWLMGIVVVLARDD